MCFEYELYKEAEKPLLKDKVGMKKVQKTDEQKEKEKIREEPIPA